MGGSGVAAVVIGVAVGLLLAWLALVVVLVIARPRLDAVRPHRQGTENGLAALVRLTGMARRANIDQD